jgi:GNAT superfamily N-acetyltransferase
MGVRTLGGDTVSEPHVYDLAGCTPGYHVTVRRAVEADVGPLADWCDAALGGDYFFRRGHLANVLKSSSCATWVVEVDGFVRGLMILYRTSCLHNLYLSPEVRSLGIGRALLALFRPVTVRAKTNMGAGDPSPFYQANGYGQPQPDPARPHIHVMQRVDQHAEASALPAQPPPGAPMPSPAIEISTRTGLPKRPCSEATKARLRALAQQQRLDRARATLAAAGELSGGRTPPGLPAVVAPVTPGVTPGPVNAAAAIVTAPAADGAWALPPGTVTPTP